MNSVFKNKAFWTILILAALFLFGFYFKSSRFNRNKTSETGKIESSKEAAPQLDVVAYDKKLSEIANNPPMPTSTEPSLVPPFASKGGTPSPMGRGEKEGLLWPVKTVYPNAGALLPFNRIVAYYGNLYSKGMGILGEYPEDEVLGRLKFEVKKWETADSATPVIPALHYIAVVAQKGAGKDGKYRVRMPDSQIDRVLKMAEKASAIVFLDLQVGLSNVQTELPLLEKYLKLPQVHLGIDPEFSMKQGGRPGERIGTLDAEDINFAAEYLAEIVKENNLTPKILVVHRFTQTMVANFKNIKPLPEVQIVMNMDGFGGQANKINTYKQYIYKEPVQFTGFKLFYKNDSENGAILTPEQLLNLSPIPVYIQYQ